MTYVLELSDKLTKKIEENAALMGATPEEWLTQLVENAPVVGTRYASDEEFAAEQERVFNKYAEAFEILAEGAK